MKYPDKPNHPRQRYLLTAKGLALYNEINKSTKKICVNLRKMLFYFRIISYLCPLKDTTDGRKE